MSKKRIQPEQPAEASEAAPPPGEEGPVEQADAASAPSPPEATQTADQQAAGQPAAPGPQEAATAGPRTGEAGGQESAVQSESAVDAQGELTALRERIEQLEAELEQARDRALRFQAELDNYRKRAAREMETERRYAALPLMRDLLAVLDNVHRAVEAGRKAAGVEGLLEGFEMVARQLEDVLRRHHCVRIEALNAPFDPNYHEAVAQRPSNEHPPNTVVEVTQPGFRLHDRVVRPSRVVVSTSQESE